MKNSWSSVTVEQFQEIANLETLDLSPTEYKIEKIAIVTDTNYFDLDEDELEEILKEYSWLEVFKPTKKTKQSFRNLTFGNFIDLEFWIASQKPIDNIDKICATIRGYTNLVDECEKIQSESITIHYATLENYIQYRSEILENYKGLFEDEEQDFEDEDETEPIEPIEVVNSKWNWQRLIYRLANGDITKANSITDMPHIMVLNWLSMESELKLTPH